MDSGDNEGLGVWGDIDASLGRFALSGGSGVTDAILGRFGLGGVSSRSSTTTIATSSVWTHTDIATSRLRHLESKAGSDSTAEATALRIARHALRGARKRSTTLALSMFSRDHSGICRRSSGLIGNRRGLSQHIAAQSNDPADFLTSPLSAEADASL